MFVRKYPLMIEHNYGKHWKTAFFIDDLPEHVINTPDFQHEECRLFPDCSMVFSLVKSPWFPWWKFHHENHDSIYGDQPNHDAAQHLDVGLSASRWWMSPQFLRKSPSLWSMNRPLCCTAVGNSPGVNHLEKIWEVRQWKGWHPIYEMENKGHVPKHQSVS